MTLNELHPTQLTLGKRKVEEKRADLKKLSDKKRRAHMAAQLYPAVKGPDKKFYVLDHHHEAMAALLEGAKEVGVGIVCDLSHLAQKDFWVYLDHPITAAGSIATTSTASASLSALCPRGSRTWRTILIEAWPHRSKQKAGLPSPMSRSSSSCGQITFATMSQRRW